MYLYVGVLYNMELSNLLVAIISYKTNNTSLWQVNFK